LNPTARPPQRLRDPFTWTHATGRELRYEWRAAMLKEQGIIDEIITHAGHFIPTRVGSAGQSLGPI